LTVSAFARKNDVSQPAISKAVKAGRLPLDENGKLGREAQRAWDASRQTRSTHSGKLVEIAELKRLREQVRLKREMLELAEKEQRMVDAAEVDAELGTRFLQFRDGLRRLPAALSPRLEGRNVETIRATLATEIDATLTELSKLRISKLKGQGRRAR
jgi:hypothetical protein